MLVLALLASLLKLTAQPVIWRPSPAAGKAAVSELVAGSCWLANGLPVFEDNGGKSSSNATSTPPERQQRNVMRTAGKASRVPRRRGKNMACLHCRKGKVVSPDGRMPVRCHRRWAIGRYLHSPMLPHHAVARISASHHTVWVSFFVNFSSSPCLIPPSR